MMSYPIQRPRRLRRSETIRRLVRETHLSPGNLIEPLFVCPGEGVRRARADIILTYFAKAAARALAWA